MRHRKEIKLLGFAPDADPIVPGVIRDCDNLVPTLDGFRPAPAPAALNLPALAAECTGGAAVKKSDDSRRTIFGTGTALYEASASTFNDVSKSGGYTSGVDVRWRLTQFGDYTIATNKLDPMQQSQSGDFADIGGGAPKAAIVASCFPGFVMALNYDDGTNDYEDGWWCSALNNPVSWTASVSTQAANGRLTETPGKIRAARPLGQQIVVYKERSMYVGTYQGPPVIWQWDLVSGEIGAPSQESVVDIGTAHIFPGYENFYIFDGVRPIPIGNPLKDWYNVNVTQTFKDRMKSLHDRDNSNVYFFYPDSSGDISAALVYNYRADKWGRASLYEGRTLQHVIEYINGGLTYHDMGALYSTWDVLPEISFDSPFWVSAATQPVVVQDDKKLYGMVGNPEDSEDGESVLHGSFIGDDELFTSMSRCRIGYISDNTYSVNVYLRTAKYVGGTESRYGPFLVSENKADFNRSAKFHAPEIVIRGDCEIRGYTMYYELDGSD